MCLNVTHQKEEGTGWHTASITIIKETYKEEPLSCD